MLDRIVKNRILISLVLLDFILCVILPTVFRDYINIDSIAVNVLMFQGVLATFLVIVVTLLHAKKSKLIVWTIAIFIFWPVAFVYALTSGLRNNLRKQKSGIMSRPDTR